MIQECHQNFDLINEFPNPILVYFHEERNFLLAWPGCEEEESEGESLALQLVLAISWFEGETEGESLTLQRTLQISWFGAVWVGESEGE